MPYRLDVIFSHAMFVFSLFCFVALLSLLRCSVLVTFHLLSSFRYVVVSLLIPILKHSNGGLESSTPYPMAFRIFTFGERPHR